MLQACFHATNCPPANISPAEPLWPVYLVHSLQHSPVSLLWLITFPLSALKLMLTLYAVCCAALTSSPSAVTVSTRPPSETSCPCSSRPVPLWNTYIRHIASNHMKPIET